GHFYIARIVDSSKWAHDFHDGKGTIEGAYGPWFLGLYTGADATFSKKSWTGIAIHGTHDDSSIGKNVSEGCIRMHNPEITEVHALAVTQNQIPVDIIQ
ncbi:MAG TPA: L,D-transpeptidase, partial [Candidatus Cloacimonadota bacterium]|nr:L,D-transpeptidase [Candidatus Cloacimonadota bacterium]